MKKKTPANTSGSENSGWESSENLDATSVLHPADVHAAAADNAPTTVFSSDETAVLSDYQDPTAVLSDYQDATQVLASHETATHAAAHSDDRTKVLTDYGSSPANKTAPAGSMNTGSANAESANTEVISSTPTPQRLLARLVLCRAPTAPPLRFLRRFPRRRNAPLRGTTARMNRCRLRAVWIRRSLR